MATSGRFRLPGVLDTFYLQGNTNNYTVVSASNGSVVATSNNGVIQSNSSDPILNNNLANGSYTATLNNAASSMTNTAASRNAATTNPNPTPSTPGGTSTASTSASANTQSSSATSSNLYVYPLNRDPKQDYIKFTILELKKDPNIAASQISSSFKPNTSTGIKNDLNNYRNLGFPSIYLPIQASITDQNAANWGSGELNELQRLLLGVSADAMTNAGSGADFVNSLGKGLGDIYNKLSGMGQGRNLVYTYLLEQAVGAPGLLSRVTGGVLNPNMELLFQGPSLRPFNFTFKMSPRNKPEADSVRSIIRAFKKNMAPKINNLFLQAPNVFKIEYVHGTTGLTHQSLNLIKVCSLQNCSVDYTPLGTYMTIDDSQDSKASMVSYTMNLTFSEITPIYQQDYDADDVKNHSIGF